MEAQFQQVLWILCYTLHLQRGRTINGCGWMQEAGLNFRMWTAMKCDLAYVKYKGSVQKVLSLEKQMKGYSPEGHFCTKWETLSPETAKQLHSLTYWQLTIWAFLKNISLELRPKVRLSNPVPFSAPSAAEKKLISAILLWCYKAKRKAEHREPTSARDSNPQP